MRDEARPVVDLVDCDSGDAGNDQVPCDQCGASVSFHDFAEHVARHLLLASSDVDIVCNDDSEVEIGFKEQDYRASSSLDPRKFWHVRKSPRRDCTDFPELVPCECCGDLFMLSEYQAHLAEHQAKISKEVDLAEFATPEALAAYLVEHLRGAVEVLGSNGKAMLPRGSVANYDLAVGFVRRARSMHCDHGSQFAQLHIVYHWTPRTNFSSIIDNNLQVPDGHSVLHRTDAGYYGTGIYTSPEFSYGEAYARGDGACFICLALPGRQHFSTYPQDFGGPCRAGYDSHVSGDRNNMEWVFFASNQLLPCFIVEDTAHVAAHSVVRSCIQTLSEKILAVGSEVGLESSSSASSSNTMARTLAAAAAESRALQKKRTW